MELRGATALITGASRRVGKGIAVALGHAGCRVIVHYRSDPKKAADTVAELADRGITASAVRADLADDDAVAAIFDGVGDLSPVQVLVNSAAMFPDDTLAGVSREAWAATLDVNVTAPVFLTQAFARALPDAIEGVVVNVTDWRTARPYQEHFSYTVAKGAIDTFTAAAAEALAPRIRVNAVALGAILPPPGRDTSYLKELAGELPLERIGSVEEVGMAVRYLAEADFVTGETIRINGGAHLR